MACRAVHYGHYYYYNCIIIIVVCALRALPSPFGADWGQHVLPAWCEATHCSWDVALTCFQWCHFARLSLLDVWPRWLPRLWRDANCAGPFWITWKNTVKTCDLWPANGRQLYRGFLLIDFVCLLTFCLREIQKRSPPSHHLTWTTKKMVWKRCLHAASQTTSILHRVWY